MPVVVTSLIVSEWAAVTIKRTTSPMVEHLAWHRTRKGLTAGKHVRDVAGH